MLAGVANLVACLDGQATPMCTGVDGVRAVEMFEAVRASADRGGARVVPGIKEIVR